MLAPPVIAFPLRMQHGVLLLPQQPPRQQLQKMIFS